MAPKAVAPQKEAPEAAPRPQGRLPEAVPPLPLVIGVTGHRDLRPQDVDRLKEQIARVFEALMERYPNTPLVLLSSLAEGADRVAADVARQSGVGLMAVLPMPLRYYDADFQPPTALYRPPGVESALDELRRLLNGANDVIELPLLTTEEEIGQSQAGRALHYEQVGAFIALHSQVLLALWDGASPPKVGGTSEVVHFQLNGVPRRYAPVRTPLDPLDSGPVYQLVTPRVTGDAGTSDPAFSLRKGFPSGERAAPPEWTAVRSPQEAPEREKPYQRVYRRIESFNRDVKSLAGSLSAAVWRSRSAVLPRGEDHALPRVVEQLLARYGVADAMALHFQDLTRRTARRLFVLTAFAALTLVLYAHGEFEPLVGYRPVLLLAYVAAILVGLGVVLWTRRGNFQNKFQDYRALAEGLRVQVFWRLAGVPGSVADHYLLKQRGELDWIRQALRVWGLQAGVREEAFEPQAADAEREDPQISLVVTHWVDDQLAYYTRAAHRNHDRHTFYGPLGKIALAVGSVLALVVAARQAVDWLRRYLEPSGWTILAMTVPLVVAGLLEGYVRVMAFSEHAKQFGRMSVVFGKAKEVLRGLTGPEHQREAQALLRDLGKEALAEHGDWLVLHRERPLEFHSPH